MNACNSDIVYRFCKLILVSIIVLLMACTEANHIQVDEKSLPQSPILMPTETPELIQNSLPTATPSSTDGRDASMEIQALDKMQNLAIEKLGPYEPDASTFGSLKYDARLTGPVFREFGNALPSGDKGSVMWNPTFEFKLPAESILLAPISGFISYVEWQPFEGDWEIHITKTLNSKLRFGIDHITSIDCDRTSKPVSPCDLPLRIGGKLVSEYTPVVAGEAIGYVGNWSGHQDTDINGRTELMVFEYINNYEGVLNHCPTLHLDQEIEQHFIDSIQELMASFEDWSGAYSTYDEENMAFPGCNYEAIKEHNGHIELIDSLENTTTSYSD
jgi:hypothetical protein